MYLRCAGCRELFKIEGDHDPLEDDLRAGPVKCPLCLQVSVSVTSVKMGEPPVQELTAQQFWMAINGFGMPDEIVTEPEAVEAMFLAHRIKRVKLGRSVSMRAVINELELDNGITFHFTASGEGAVIFKSTRTKEKKEDAS